MAIPKNRYEVQIHIGADSRQSLIEALQSILFNVENYKVDDEEIDLVSGGYHSGYSVTGRVDKSITGDSYRAALKAYKKGDTDGK